MKPKRKETRVVKIQRKDGRVIQDCDLYIGRAWKRGGWDLTQSKWASPFTVKQHGRILGLYEEHVRNRPDLMNSLYELDGKILGCWCKPKPCHGDVLVKLLKEKKNKFGVFNFIDHRDLVENRKARRKGEGESEEEEDNKDLDESE